MSISIKDVEKLAELARIELTDEEKQALVGDMESILNYIKMIESVDLDEVKVERKQRNVWREDVADSDKYDEGRIVKQFPESKDNYLKVKKIL